MCGRIPTPLVSYNSREEVKFAIAAMEFLGFPIEFRWYKPPELSSLIRLFPDLLSKILIPKSFIRKLHF